MLTSLFITWVELIQAEGSNSLDKTGSVNEEFGGFLESSK